METRLKTLSQSQVSSAGTSTAIRSLSPTKPPPSSSADALIASSLVFSLSSKSACPDRTLVSSSRSYRSTRTPTLASTWSGASGVAAAMAAGPGASSTLSYTTYSLPLFSSRNSSRMPSNLSAPIPGPSVWSKSASSRSPISRWSYSSTSWSKHSSISSRPLVSSAALSLASLLRLSSSSPSGMSP